MKIEHFAIQVEEPRAVAQWYCAHLGFEVRRSVGPPTHTHFLADASGNALLEIYNNPKVSTPDYRAFDPLLLHLAFAVDDPEATRDRLLAAGATVAEEFTITAAGDRLVMLRDPWGFAIQLVQRAEPML
jgi:uncharacterized glyoxalase superfamily protein PhnB